MISNAIRHLVAVSCSFSWHCCATSSAAECSGSHFSRCAVSVLFDPGTDMLTCFTIDTVTYYCHVQLPHFGANFAQSAGLASLLLVGWQAFLNDDSLDAPCKEATFCICMNLQQTVCSHDGLRGLLAHIAHTAKTGGCHSPLLMVLARRFWLLNMITQHLSTTLVHATL